MSTFCERWFGLLKIQTYEFACKKGLDQIGFRRKFFKLSIAKLSGLREKEVDKFLAPSPSVELRVVGENFEKYRCYAVERQGIGVLQLARSLNFIDGFKPTPRSRKIQMLVSNLINLESYSWDWWKL